jgi:hypothetical protein
VQPVAQVSMSEPRPSDPLRDLPPFGRVHVEGNVAGPPRLFVVIDTEEEFDWGAPFSRTATAVTAMRDIGRVQRLFDAAGVVPTYVIDYPVATQAEGYEALADWARRGRCRIGAHLHPWVTPPFDEPVTAENSFASNLPPALQAAKLERLCSAIDAHTGVAPTVFKAGRYGISAALLAEFPRRRLEVDASVNPCMNFAAEHGPDFSAFDPRPFWFGGEARLLETPCTHGFIGRARAAGVSLAAAARRLERVRLPGILSRTGLLNQVMLSPEGNTLREMIALTRALLGDGLRTFSMTFHSPSVVPGHTPYVRTAADGDRFRACIEGYLAFFLGDAGGVASTPDAFRHERLAASVVSA